MPMICLRCQSHAVDGDNIWCMFCLAMRAEQLRKEQLAEIRQRPPEIPEGDPVVHHSAERNGWVFWNASFELEIGPFDTPEIAADWFRRYAERVSA